MSRLEQYLLKHKVLAPGELREAEHSKAVYGGRLGTNLVKLGLMELEELAAHLSDASGVPLPPMPWLEEPDERAAQVLPMPLIRRYKLLPLALEKTKLHVAMLDPTDPVQLDFIATASGREVVPYVLPEIRLLYWLEHHLGIDRHPRFVNLSARSRSLGLLEEQIQTQEPDSLPPAPPEEADEDGPEMLLLEDLIGPAPIETTAASPAAGTGFAAAPRSSAEVATLEAELDGAGDRDEIVRLVLRIARAYSRAAALFLVRGGIVSSFRGDGECLSEQLPGIELPILTESIFAQPAAALTPFRGEPPEDGIDGRLLDVLGRGGVREVVVRPISIRGRVVNLLYADNGPDPFGETSVAALTALCACVSRAYERVILAQKEIG